MSHHFDNQLYARAARITVEISTLPVGDFPLVGRLQSDWFGAAARSMFSAALQYPQLASRYASRHAEDRPVRRW